MADIFSKSSCDPTIYDWLYEKSELVRFYNDNDDAYYKRRWAKRNIEFTLPKARQELSEKKEKLEELREQEKKLSTFIKQFCDDDTNDVWFVTLYKVPDVPELGNIDEWKTVSHTKACKKNKQRMSDFAKKRLQVQYFDKIEERDKIIAKNEKLALRNSNIKEINKAVKDLENLRLKDIRFLRRKIRQDMKTINKLKNESREQKFEVPDDPIDGRIKIYCDQYYEDSYYSSEDEYPTTFWGMPKKKKNTTTEVCVGYESDDDNFHYMDDPKYDIDYW